MVGSTASANIKFLCGYGGKILPRHTDGKLRYHGGHTRLLSVDRSISFSELMVKLGEMYGAPVALRCQLPTEDLDALVSITCDEDLANLLEEYNRCGQSKIRAFLLPPKSTKRDSVPLSSASSSSSNDSVLPKLSNPAPKSFASSGGVKCFHRMSKPSMVFPRYYGNGGGRASQCAHHHLVPGNTGRVYLIHHGNYWQ